jgi:hypothetical protein
MKIYLVINPHIKKIFYYYLIGIIRKNCKVTILLIKVKPLLQIIKLMIIMKKIINIKRAIYRMMGAFNNFHKIKI